VTDRPEPVLAAGNTVALVSTAGTALATIAVALGLASQTDADALLEALVVALGAVLALVHLIVPIWQARRVRELVTPVADPRDAANRELKPLPLPPSLTEPGAGHILVRPPPEPKPPDVTPRTPRDDTA
jgi:hypothetical protein